MQVMSHAERLRPCRPRVISEDDRYLRELALTRPKLKGQEIVARFREITGKPLYLESARRRVAQFRKAAGWVNGREGDPSDAPDPVAACPPGESPPCGDCGTTHGPIANGYDRPRRLDGTRFGFSVPICLRCYRRLAARLAHSEVSPCADCGDSLGFQRQGDSRPTRFDGSAFGFDGQLCLDCYQEHRHARQLPREDCERIKTEIKAAKLGRLDASRDPVVQRQQRFAELAQKEREQTRLARLAVV